MHTQCVSAAERSSYMLQRSDFAMPNRLNFVEKCRESKLWLRCVYNSDGSRVWKRGVSSLWAKATPPP